MNKEEVLEFLKSKKQEFRVRFHVKEIALFGSLARGEQNGQSDIDLLVDFEPGTECIYEMKEGIRKLVGDHFQVSVDIGTEKYLKHYYKKQILSNAIFI